MKNKIPTILIILDGYGIAEPSRNNAISLAKKPRLDRLFELYPSSALLASGIHVGLCGDQMSGSETGHINIGAGRIVIQDCCVISNSIANESFFMNPALVGAMSHIKKYGGNFHIMGLMGTADSPHSSPEHFRALLKLAKRNGIKEVYCHLFTDGRDSYPRSALTHLKNFQNIISEEGIGKIASLAGRFYAMDRVKNWKRLTKAHEVIVFNRGERAASPEEVIENAYRKGLTDEYVIPTNICENGEPIAKLSVNDSLVFFNFRSDRARQFSKLFVSMNKKRILSDNMPIIDKVKNLYFVAMTDFGPDLDMHTVLENEKIMATLPMALGGYRQLYIAESEKFAHVTYFLNGGYDDLVDGEDRIIINSPEVDSYADYPEMSSNLITSTVLEHLKRETYDFYTINYANPDMLGHTGNLAATVKGIEALDRQIGLLAKEVLDRGGNMFITADHGNAEDMFDEDVNEINTFHTKNPVPFLAIGKRFKGMDIKSGGVLGNIAPTILSVMGVEKPRLMDRDSLFM